MLRRAVKSTPVGSRQRQDGGTYMTGTSKSSLSLSLEPAQQRNHTQWGAPRSSHTLATVALHRHHNSNTQQRTHGGRSWGNSGTERWEGAEFGGAMAAIRAGHRSSMITVKCMFWGWIYISSDKRLKDSQLASASSGRVAFTSSSASSWSSGLKSYTIGTTCSPVRAPGSMR